VCIARAELVFFGNGRGGERHKQHTNVIEVSYLLKTKLRFLTSITCVILYDLPVLSNVPEDRSGRLVMLSVSVTKQDPSCKILELRQSERIEMPLTTRYTTHLCSKELETETGKRVQLLRTHCR
jgi:hypothetical protein